MNPWPMPNATRLSTRDRLVPPPRQLPASILAGDLLFALRKKGVLFETTTLHIGLDTFKPVEAENVHDHQIHTEWAALNARGGKTDQ